MTTNSSLVNFIKEGLSKGFSLEILKQKLLAKGWKNEMINEAIKEISNQNEKINLISKTPSSLIFCSVLYYIQAVLLILVPILIFILGTPILREIGLFVENSFVLISLIIGISFAILFFFIARGLLKKQKWSRIISVIFSILGFLSALSFLVSGRIIEGTSSLLIEGFILWTLLFNKKIKQFFNSR